MKSSPCYNCPDRMIDPNCHMNCGDYDGYRDEIDAEKKADQLARLNNFGRKVIPNQRRKSCDYSKYGGY